MYVIYIYFTAPQILPGAQGKGGRDEYISFIQKFTGDFVNREAIL